MKKLELLELSNVELTSIHGGSRWKLVKNIVKWLGIDAAIDFATDEFMTGWNSVECGC